MIHQLARAQGPSLFVEVRWRAKNSPFERRAETNRYHVLFDIRTNGYAGIMPFGNEVRLTAATAYSVTLLWVDRRGATRRRTPRRRSSLAAYRKVGRALIERGARLFDRFKILLCPHPNAAEGGSQTETEIG